MWPREICTIDIKRRACDLGKPLGGERVKGREKNLPRVKAVQYSDRKNFQTCFRSTEHGAPGGVDCLGNI